MESPCSGRGPAKRGTSLAPCLPAAVAALVAVLVAASPIAAAEAARQPVELTVMTWMYQTSSPAWVEIEREFEARYPHIRLNLVSGGREEQMDKLLLMAAAGTPVDAVWVDAAMTNFYVLNGLLEDLQPFFEASGVPMDQYAAAGFDEHRYGASIYGFPSTMGTYFFYYNQDIFDRRGVPYPDGDWDREQFLETARRLRDVDAGIYAVDNRNWVTTFLPWLWAHGGDWFTPDRRRSALDSEVAIEVQRFLVDLIHVYGVHIPYPDDTDYFGMGRLAMLHSSTWDLQGTELDPPKWGFRWSVVPPPRGPSGQFTVVQTNGWAIPKASTHKEEAWTFIRWFNGPEGQQILSAHGEFPAHLPTARSESFLHLDPATRSNIFAAVLMGRPFPVNPAWQDSLAIAWRLQGEALSGAKDPGVALVEAAEEINARIADLERFVTW